MDILISRKCSAGNMPACIPCQLDVGCPGVLSSIPGVSNKDLFSLG